MSKLSWVTRNSFLTFKGHLMGMYSIPISENSGHCPTLCLSMSYLDKNQESQKITYQQFKYLIRKFRKIIACQGHTDFVLEFIGFFMNGKQEITQNLYTVYKELKKMSYRHEYFDCYETDKEVTVDFRLYSRRRG